MRVREIGNSILAGAFALLCLPISVAPTVARAAEDVTCQLDWLPSGGKAPVFIGVVKGFFAEDGLNVTVKSSRGAGDAIIRAATGTADFATGDMGTLLNARAQGAVPVKAFFSVYTKLPDSVITVKGNGITTIKDLVGKTVGNAPFGGEDALWAAVLSLNGIDPKSVKMVSLDPKVHGPMLASGKVDALIDWATGAPGFAHVLAQAGKQIDIIPWANYGLEGYGLSVFTSEKMIRERPQTVARFAHAFRKSLMYTLAHPEESGPAVKALAPEVDAGFETENWTQSVWLIDNEISKRDGIGTFEPALLKKTWMWVAKSHGYPIDKIDPEQAVDRSFLGE